MVANTFLLSRRIDGLQELGQTGSAIITPRSYESATTKALKQGASLFDVAKMVKQSSAQTKTSTSGNQLASVTKGSVPTNHLATAQQAQANAESISDSSENSIEKLNMITSEIPRDHAKLSQGIEECNTKVAAETGKFASLKQERESVTDEINSLEEGYSKETDPHTLQIPGISGNTDNNGIQSQSAGTDTKGDEDKSNKLKTLFARETKLGKDMNLSFNKVNKIASDGNSSLGDALGKLRASVSTAQEEQQTANTNVSATDTIIATANGAIAAGTALTAFGVVTPVGLQLVAAGKAALAAGEVAKGLGLGAVSAADGLNSKAKKTSALEIQIANDFKAFIKENGKKFNV
ncbi:MAG: hypothetical protein PHC64_02390 [Candidatus Gastranaerophilales bacterium]|nr:hypothetical protein [Candidatus Gastranaerophilales bacterium]